eukprot:TRINITY_DN254_c0_g2_i2.p1 TRINITY_DN254_c0_g2~~TRINITY_DN254_c0_g2_i2.p1  ORF type:complete len:376 (+),score=52.51 TRINITY_DN254_c0_g2_i2:39-1166(+)
MEATTIAVHFEDQRSELDISSSPITSLKDLLDRCRDLFRFPPDANLTVGFKDDGDDGQIKNDRFAKTVQAGDELEIRTSGARTTSPQVSTLDLGRETQHVILFGKTGHGKSLLGSILLGWKPGDHPPFQSSDNTNSCTVGITPGRAGNLTVWDSQGLQDTGNQTTGPLWESHQELLSSYVDNIERIGGDGVDALLYVINEARVDAKDGETAQMLAKFFQGGNIQQHTYLIFTRSDNPHRNKDQWLDTNCQNNPHFKAVYELVGCDPSHTIFIDSKNYVNTTRMEDRNSWAQQNNESLLRIQEMICTTRPNNPLTLDAVVLRASLQKHLADELEAANTIQAEIDRCQKVAADLQKTIDQGYKRPKQSSRGLFCVLA